MATGSNLFGTQQPAGGNSPFGTTPKLNLFGSSQPQQQSSPSPFGTLGGGASNTQQQQQPSASTSPFGGLGGSTLNAPSQPQQSTSPFGALGGAASNTQTQQQPSTSPFGGLGGTTLNTQPQAGNSLFGAQSTQNQPAASNAFGGLGLGASPKPASSMFGAASTGGLGATSAFGNSAAPAAGSLGGGGGGGLNAGNSILGAAPGAASTNGGGVLPQGNTTGYFDSLLAKSKKQANGESPLEDLPSLQLGLGDLRQRLRKLGPRAPTDPRQHGNIHQMLVASGVDPGAAVKDLNSLNFQATVQAERPSHGPAATDIDVEAYLANLQTKTTLSMIADGLERSVKDFDNFLEDNITMEWEAQRMRIYEHFGIKTRDDGPVDTATGMAAKESTGGFGRSRRNPKGGRSTNQGAKSSAFGRSNLQKSVIGAPSKIGFHQPAFKENGEQNGDMAPLSNAGDDRFLREKQGHLAERVRQLNIARLEKVPYPVLSELAAVESRSGDSHSQYIVDAYHAAMAIVGEVPDADTFAAGATAKERCFREMYMDPNDKSQNAINMRKRILAGGTEFLEKKFYRDLETMIHDHQREASMGGRPDVVSKIKAYVRLRSARNNLVADNVELQQVDGEYIWAHVYFLLRTGHVTEAAEYVKSRATSFRSIDRTFSSYLLEYAASPDRRLRRQLQERCNNEYSQRVRIAPSNSIDAYRMACYKIVGRCDISNRSLDGLTTNIDDWVWLQFNLARENDRTAEVASESFTLSDLQKSVQEIGKRHFPKTPADDTNGAFGMFFFLQVLSGLFEQAIAYLYPFSYVDAIHFAIGLEYYGLLRPCDPWSTPNDLLSFDTRGNAQLNYGRMLGYYTRDFRAADVASAVDYLVMICLNADLASEAGRQQAELCHIALRELVLETREFSKLIGDIRPDGHRITGLIEERSALIGLREEDDFVKAVTLQAARFADDNGRTTDAVLLYHLAGDYDSVVTIISRALSEAISLEIGEDPMRLVPVKPRAADGAQQQQSQQPGSSLSLAAIDDPVQLAATMMAMYEQDAMFYTKIEGHNKNACHILLQMSEIKGLVETGQWPEALDVSTHRRSFPLLLSFHFILSRFPS